MFARLVGWACRNEAAETPSKADASPPKVNAKANKLPKGELAGLVRQMEDAEASLLSRRTKGAAKPSKDAKPSIEGSDVEDDALGGVSGSFDGYESDSEDLGTSSHLLSDEDDGSDSDDSSDEDDGSDSDDSSDEDDGSDSDGRYSYGDDYESTCESASADGDDYESTCESTSVDGDDAKSTCGSTSVDGDDSINDSLNVMDGEAVRSISESKRAPSPSVEAKGDGKLPKADSSAA
ncbi:MAG: hypothetical protein ACKER6_00645, partial [Candidatus Hodgkinia cicadicola]